MQIKVKFNKSTKSVVGYFDNSLCLISNSKKSTVWADV